MTRYILTCALLVLANFSFGQENYFREYLSTPILVNPAFMAMSNDAALFLNYRNQNVGPDYNLQTSKLSFKYPLIGANERGRWGAAGLAMIDDRVGNHTFLKQQSIIPSLAYNINLKQSHYLSFALNAAFHRLSLDHDMLKTGMQYVPERGFIFNLPSGENFPVVALTYTGIDFGMLWYYQENDYTDAWMGFSITNLNSPNISLLENNQVQAPSRMNLTGGVNLLSHSQVALITDFLLSYQNSRANLLYGGKLEYFLTGESANKVLSAGVHHAWGKSMIFSAGLRQQHFSFTFNYEVDMGRNTSHTPFYNATEYALVLKKTIFPPKKNKKKRNTINEQVIKPPTKKSIQITLAKKSKNDSSLLENNVIITNENEPEPTDEQDFINETKEDNDNRDASIVGNMQRLNFDFNSSKIKEDSYRILLQIVETMQREKELKIMLIGHTDNFGSDAANLMISKDRAEAIAQFLVSSGIEKSRIRTTGKGEKQPLNDNSTPEKRAENRRVEFIIF